MLDKVDRFYKVIYRREADSFESVYLSCNNIPDAMEGIEELEREHVAFIKLVETKITTLQTREMVPIYKIEEVSC